MNTTASIPINRPCSTPEQFSVPTLLTLHLLPGALGSPGVSAQWGWVQPAIAECATVVSYDRRTQLEHAKPLGDLPLTVLSAGTSSLEEQQLHGELALPSRGSHTSVAEAPHLSLLTDSEHSGATVDAVRATLTAAETAARKPR